MRTRRKGLQYAGSSPTGLRTEESCLRIGSMTGQFILPISPSTCLWPCMIGFKTTLPITVETFGKRGPDTTPRSLSPRRAKGRADEVMEEIDYGCLLCTGMTRMQSLRTIWHSRSSPLREVGPGLLRSSTLCDRISSWTKTDTPKANSVTHA